MTSRPPAGGAAHYASSSSIRSDSQLSPRPSGQPGGPLEAFKGSPAAAPAQAPAQMLAPEEAARLTAQGHTHLRLDLRGLAPTDDPFAPLHAMWAEELSAAQAAGVPPVLTLLPPPQPYTYHVELEGWETEADAVGEGGEAEQAGAQEVQDEGAAGQQQEGAGQEGAGQGEGAGPEEGQPQPQEAAAAAAADAAAAGEGSPQRSAPDAGPPPPKPTFEADVPLVPFRTRYASTPVVLQPPEAPVVEPDAPAAGSKAAKAAAAKAAAKAPAKPSPKGARASSRGADGGAEAGPVKLDRGCLQAVVPLPARVRARNWLRNGALSGARAGRRACPRAATCCSAHAAACAACLPGVTSSHRGPAAPGPCAGIQLKLYVTRLEAVLKPEPVQPPEPPEPAPVATKGGKGKRPTSSDKNKDRPRSGKKEKEPVPEPPVGEWAQRLGVFWVKQLGGVHARASSAWAHPCAPCPPLARAPRPRPPLARGLTRLLAHVRRAPRCAVDLTKYDFVPHTTLLGLATLRAGALLVKGSAEQASEAVVFTPVPALWDERGMRMALEDPRHSKRAVAHMEATLALHVPLPDLRAIPILQNFPGMAPPPPAGKGK